MSGTPGHRMSSKRFCLDKDQTPPDSEDQTHMTVLRAFHSLFSLTLCPVCVVSVFCSAHVSDPPAGSNQVT